MNAPDPDLYGPPERGNEEPGLYDFTLEAILEALADMEDEELTDG